MTTRNIKNHEQSAAKFLYNDNGALCGLRSYSTTVIYIDDEGWMTVTGLYSRTTIKHIGWFMREIGKTYQDAKLMYLNNERYNIHTGEIIIGA